MNPLNLPLNTRVDKIIPKNSFDSFATPKQKRKFIDLVERIRWSNKLSRETINLHGSDFSEIQVFLFELREKEGFEELLEVIDRAIPYPIIFCVTFDNKILFSASQKHPHPTNGDLSIVDWVFKSDWHDQNDHLFYLHLKKTLDHAFFDFCRQLSGKSQKIANLAELSTYEQSIKKLKTAITKLEGEIFRCKQFNKRVELNIQLQKKLSEYQNLIQLYK